MAVSLIHEMTGVEIQTSDTCYLLRGPQHNRFSLNSLLKLKTTFSSKTDTTFQELKTKGL